jgi:hypothetical protein
VLTQVLDAGRTLLTLPGALERVLSRMETGQLEVRIAEDGRDGTATVFARRARRRAARQPLSGLAAFAITIASLAAGVVLALNQLVLPAWFCLALAALAAAPACSSAPAAPGTGAAPRGRALRGGAHARAFPRDSPSSPVGRNTRTRMRTVNATTSR